jgi:hypothetical protein
MITVTHANDSNAPEQQIHCYVTEKRHTQYISSLVANSHTANSSSTSTHLFHICEQLTI